MSAPASRRHQVAALPYRHRADGGVEILLVTSRETRRWVLPKGWASTKREPWESAAREASEEAGLSGVVAQVPIGAYGYDKRLRHGTLLSLRVDVYPLAVAAESASWPEQAERERRWATPAEAAGLVDEPDLAALLLAFAP